MNGDIDAVGDLRYQFFIEHGFPPEKFEQIGIGPVYTSLHAQFLREVRFLGETVTNIYALSGLSPRGGHWKVHHEVVEANRKKAMSIEIEGAILDLTTRKPVLPEAELFKIFNLIQRTADFEVLGESRWIK